MSIESVMPSNHLILSCPLLLLPSMPQCLPSIRVFSSESALRIRWPEYYFRVLPSRCCSVAKSCLILCKPMNCSTPSLPVHQHFPEFTQTHVHWVSDAIQPSHLLSSPSPPTFNLPSIRVFTNSQFFTSGGQSIRVLASASVLPMNIQDWSLLGGLARSPCNLRDSQESSPTSQFKSINSSSALVKS